METDWNTLIIMRLQFEAVSILPIRNGNHYCRAPKNCGFLVKEGKYLTYKEWKHVADRPRNYEFLNHNGKYLTYKEWKRASFPPRRPPWWRQSYRVSTLPIRNGNTCTCRGK